jgi:hypothetical protein
LKHYERGLEAHREEEGTSQYIELMVKGKSGIGQGEVSLAGLAEDGKSGSKVFFGKFPEYDRQRDHAETKQEILQGNCSKSDIEEELRTVHDDRPPGEIAVENDLEPEHHCDENPELRPACQTGSENPVKNYNKYDRRYSHNCVFFHRRFLLPRKYLVDSQVKTDTNPTIGKKSHSSTGNPSHCNPAMYGTLNHQWPRAAATTSQIQNGRLIPRIAYKRAFRCLYSPSFASKLNISGKMTIRPSRMKYSDFIA